MGKITEDYRMKTLNAISVITVFISTLVCSCVFAQGQTTTITTMPTSNPSAPVPATMPAPNEDPIILASVQIKLSQDSTLAAANFISISVSQGVVTLAGVVDTQAQADAAMNAAKTVPGVQNVTSTITIRSSNTTAPTTINPAPTTSTTTNAY